MQHSDVPSVRNGPSLIDPVSCGEDIVHNLRRVASLAQELCAGCMDYHVANAAVRLLDNSPWNRGARRALAEAVRPIFSELSKTGDGPIDAVIAASADTAVLSLLAHSAALHGPKVADRVHFTVIDKCRTPLALCEDYAGRHRLRIETQCLNLCETERVFPADFIVLHNLLPFIPPDRHVDLLRMLGGWLKPDGRIVLWQLVLPPDDRERDHATRSDRAKAVIELLNERKIDCGGLEAKIVRSVETYAAHAIEKRPGQPEDRDESGLKEILVSAGLEVSALGVRPHNCTLRSKLYVMIVASKPRS